MSRSSSGSSGWSGMPGHCEEIFTEKLVSRRYIMAEVKTSKSPMSPPQVSSESTASLLRELVPHLRQNRTQLRQEWARRITEAKLLTAMSADEIFTEATAVYDQYVEALETGPSRPC